MGIIIGAGTTIGGNFINSNSHCIISANWNYNPNTQRLYCLGDWTANNIIRRPTYTISLTLYSSGPTYSTSASTSCTTAAGLGKTLSVSAAGCEGGEYGLGPFGEWVVTGYGYNKDDPQMPSQESWSLQRWANEGGHTGPTYLIRGIAEGSVAEEVENYAGITLTDIDDTGSQGSVSAGAVGRSDNLITGVATNVGASSDVTGKIGQGNVTIPYTPLWI